jgi:hypothetical protein
MVRMLASVQRVIMIIGMMNRLVLLFEKYDYLFNE